ncbi:PDGF/VEGF domain [Trinorchestia longiramus]|nr:PDGF/VEGF domain [Trinorchestia longiramus]
MAHVRVYIAALCLLAVVCTAAEYGEESWGTSGTLVRNDDVSYNEAAPVVFPGDVAGREEDVKEPSAGESAPMTNMNFEEMTMSEQLQISAVNTIEDFVRMLNVSLPPSRGGLVAASTSGDSSIAARFGGSGDDGLSVPTLANCSLENQTVRLKIEPQLNVIFFPMCVRLPRCSGCCTGPLLKCRPTDVKPVQLKILKLEQNGVEPQGRAALAPTTSVTSRRRRPKPEGSRRRRETTSSYVIVEEEEHLSCSCQCRVQEQDCNPTTHDYLANECRCACKNHDEQDKCESRSDTHYWHKEDCMCYCYHEDTCSTGQLFDHNSCSCTNADFRSRSGVSFRRGAVASPPVAFPGQ